MLQTIKNAFKIPELRKKLIYTLIILLIYRFGAIVPVPFVQSSLISLPEGSIFEYLNILSGDAFSKATLFALSISPYITASIVIQLLCVAIPALEKLSKEGEEGKKKLNTITRFVTVGLALLTSVGYYMLMRNTYRCLTADGETWYGAVVIIACYCAGASIIMWLGEKINENGIGNGISMILFANIVSAGPAIISSLISSFTSYFSQIANGEYIGILWCVLTLVMIAAVCAIVVFVVFITDSERRLPVQYAKRVVGRKMYGGQSSNLPIKLNMSGVMPIIFASSIISLPITIMQFCGVSESNFWFKLFGTSSPVYIILFFVLIIAFSYFYIAISFNPQEVSNNLQKNGGFIPGIRPGRPTAEYITKVLSKVTLMGAMFLSVIAVLPLIVNALSGNALAGIAFSGSSLLIVVGVAIETAREIEAQMTMRHYKGFLE
ncbi:MAG: preprotein translocase subunit SecY [Clostridia bacterium]|nr:preprotein translocase subunit SecY [Clostridia bacterium]